MKTGLLLIACALLAGCVSITGAAMKKLQPGMSKTEALKITGPADGYNTAGGLEIYTFTDPAIDFNSPNRADYQAVFKDGRLISWGAAGIRSTPMVPVVTF